MSQPHMQKIKTQGYRPQPLLEMIGSQGQTAQPLMQTIQPRVQMTKPHVQTIQPHPKMKGTQGQMTKEIQTRNTNNMSKRIEQLITKAGLAINNSLGILNPASPGYLQHEEALYTVIKTRKFHP